MRIVNKKAIDDFKRSHADAAKALDAWISDVENAQWSTPIQLKERYPKASILKAGHVVFDIVGNRYRLWVQITYKNDVVFVKKIGTHKEYDGWEIR